MSGSRGRLPFAEMLRYGLVGLLNTAVGLSAIYAGMHLLGLQYAVANVLGYSIGLVASFLLNKRFTFRSAGAVTWSQPLLFLAVFGVSFAVQFGVLLLLVEGLRVNRSLAQLLAMGAYTATGYAGNRFLTFRARDPSAAGGGHDDRPASC